MRKGIARTVTRMFGRPRARDAVREGVPGLFAHSRPPPEGFEGVRPYHLVTKNVARDKPQRQDVRAALRMWVEALNESQGVDMIFMPRLGCGLDGLAWEGAGGVREITYEELGRLSFGPEVVLVEYDQVVAPVGADRTPAGPSDGPRGTGAPPNGPRDAGAPSGVGGPSNGPHGTGAPSSGPQAAAAAPAEVAAAAAAGPSTRASAASDPMSDPGSASAEDGGDEAATVPLSERLREAVRDAQLRAGRSRPARIATAIVAGGLARQLRLARKERLLAANRSRLKLHPHPIPADAAEPATAAGAAASMDDSDAVGALRQDFGDEVAAAATAPVQLPASAPDREPETEGPAHPMPRARAAWARERARQLADPFVAGRRGCVEFDWIDPPPPPPSGHVWRWGPLASADDANLGALLAKEVRQRAIELVGWGGVDVVTPVFIARHPVTGKLRLVHDLRSLCARMRLSTVDYDRAADALLGGAHAAKVDLLSAFRHCSLTVPDQRRMGFVVGRHVWRWRVLPFGASQSPELYCAALASTVRALRARGVKLVVYVDDILILGDTPEELDAAVEDVFESLSADGWYIALDKAFLTVPATVMPFLGVLVDLSASTLRVSVGKANKFAAYCAAVLDHAGGRLRRDVITLRELQKVGGTLAFLATASPLAGLMRSAIDAATAQAMRLPGRTVALRGALRAELVFWRQNAGALPRLPVPRQGLQDGVAVVTDAAGEPFLGWGAVAWPGSAQAPPVEEWLAGRQQRPGNVAAGAVAGFGKLSWDSVRHGTMSSAALEVQALRRALRWLHGRAPGCIDGKAITWYCDAQSAIGAVRKWRSKAAGLAHETRVLFEFCLAHGCSVRPVWVARELGWQPVADFLSRMAARANSAEWRLPREVYDELCGRFGFRPTVDLFASPDNTLCAAYVTQHPVRGGVRVDAFAAPWHGVRGYAFPPFSQAGRMLRHLACARGARVLSVLPAEVPVPRDVRVVASCPLAVPLVDAVGRPAPAVCPRPLVACVLESPADGAS